MEDIQSAVDELQQRLQVALHDEFERRQQEGREQVVKLRVERLRARVTSLEAKVQMGERR